MTDLIEEENRRVADMPRPEDPRIAAVTPQGYPPDFVRDPAAELAYQEQAAREKAAREAEVARLSFERLKRAADKADVDADRVARLASLKTSDGMAVVSLSLDPTTPRNLVLNYPAELGGRVTIRAGKDDRFDIHPIKGLSELVVVPVRKGAPAKGASSESLEYAADRTDPRPLWRRAVTWKSGWRLAATAQGGTAIGEALGHPFYGLAAGIVSGVLAALDEVRR